MLLNNKCDGLACILINLSTGIRKTFRNLITLLTKCDSKNLFEKKSTNPVCTIHTSQMYCYRLLMIASQRLFSPSKEYKHWLTVIDLMKWQSLASSI